MAGSCRSASFEVPVQDRLVPCRSTTFRSRSVAVVRRFSRGVGERGAWFVLWGVFWAAVRSFLHPSRVTNRTRSCFVSGFVFHSSFSLFPLPSIRCAARRCKSVHSLCSLRCRSFLFFFSLFFFGGGENRVPCAVFAVGIERGLIRSIPNEWVERSTVVCGPF